MSLRYKAHGMPDMSPRTHCIRVDPLKPYRVWLTITCASGDTDCHTRYSVTVLFKCVTWFRVLSPHLPCQGGPHAAQQGVSSEGAYGVQLTITQVTSCGSQPGMPWAGVLLKSDHHDRWDAGGTLPSVPSVSLNCNWFSPSRGCVRMKLSFRFNRHQHQLDPRPSFLGMLCILWHARDWIAVLLHWQLQADWHQHWLSELQINSLICPSNK